MTGKPLEAFWLWQGPCSVCGKWNTFFDGVFCSNFGHHRGIFQPCFNSWCAKCYRASDDVKFHVNLAEDDEGLVWKRKEDRDQYMIARKCDNAFTPFQCDQCWFRNSKKRDPLSISQADKRLLVFIRRTNLDVFWSRTKDTIDKSTLGLRRFVKDSQNLGFQPILEL